MFWRQEKEWEEQELATVLSQQCTIELAIAEWLNIFISVPFLWIFHLLLVFLTHTEHLELNQTGIEISSSWVAIASEKYLARTFLIPILSSAVTCI